VCRVVCVRVWSRGKGRTGDGLTTALCLGMELGMFELRFRCVRYEGACSARGKDISCVSLRLVS